MSEQPPSPRTTDELRRQLDDIEAERAADRFAQRATQRAAAAGLPPLLQMLAGLAQRAALDGVGEDDWLIEHADIAMLQALPEQPHADAGSRLDQAAAILRDHRLWPWG
jgi:hypothetical protein